MAWVSRSTRRVPPWSRGRLLTPTFGPEYRELLDRVLLGSWDQVVRDADTFLGVEVPELRWWQFGSAEAKRIRGPVLSLVGEESDAAFLEFEELLSGLLPRLETARVPGANHLLCLKQPRPVAESLARFLARHPLR